MKGKFLILFALSLIVLSGCVESMRYSPDEIKDFPPAIQTHIKRGEIVIGMTPLQVRYAWGAPSSVNILQPSESGKYREEWIYSRKLGIFKTQLIFTDGRLTEIITTEPAGVRDGSYKK